MPWRPHTCLQMSAFIASIPFSLLRTLRVLHQLLHFALSSVSTDSKREATLSLSYLTLTLRERGLYTLDATANFSANLQSSLYSRIGNGFYDFTSLQEAVVRDGKKAFVVSKHCSGRL